jgi:hypothetical protein
MLINDDFFERKPRLYSGEKQELLTRVPHGLCLISKVRVSRIRLWLVWLVERDDNAAAAAALVAPTKSVWRWMRFMIRVVGTCGAKGKRNFR